MIVGVALGVVLVLALCCGGAGFGVWYLNDSRDDTTADLSGVVDYRRTRPDLLSQEHRDGPITYPASPSPPVGGPHNTRWQNCDGDVYSAPIATEHAVHSLEHGAVWVTYRPDLPAEDVATLTALVRGKPYSLMSPYADQSAPISLQAWGYQLTTTSADDERIAAFLTRYRQTASIEPGATCSLGVTATGTAPVPTNTP